MKTAQHCFCTLRLLLIAGLFWADASNITIYTAKTALLSQSEHSQCLSEGNDENIMSSTWFSTKYTRIAEGLKSIIIGLLL